MALFPFYLVAALFLSYGPLNDLLQRLVRLRARHQVMVGKDQRGYAGHAIFVCQFYIGSDLLIEYLALQNLLENPSY